jgi:rod shape-determining protein MreC
LKRYKGCFGICVLILAALCGSAVYAAVTGGIAPLRMLTAGVMLPLQNAAVQAGDFAEDTVASIFAYRELEEENDALRAVAAMYRAREGEAERALSENDALRDVLGMRRRYRDLTLVPANIVARENSAGELYTLNRGEKDGITVGDMAITYYGMTGVVSEVGDTWCATVRSYYPAVAVSVALPYGETGIAVGDGAAGLSLSVLPSEREITPDLRVSTSGLGGVYPPDIPVGRVRTVGTAADGLSLTVALSPFVTEVPEQVFIITDFIYED